MIAAGRMAFTNYLMHTLVFTTIFYGHGLGLFGAVSRPVQALMVAAFALVVIGAELSGLLPRLRR